MFIITFPKIIGKRTLANIVSKWYTLRVKNAILHFCAAIALVGNFVLCGCSAQGYTVFTDTAFSDDIIFTARIIGGRARYAYDSMKSLIASVNAQVSLTAQDSDLQRFNAAAAGDTVQVGEHCYNLFNLSREYYELTDGSFNCALVSASELWHVDTEGLSELGGGYADYSVLPRQEQTALVMSVSDPTLVTAHSANGKYYLTKAADGVRLDFGGIAKGYAIDECVRILDGYSISSALLDISGNVYFYGDYIRGDWNVGVMSPRPRNALTRGYVCAFSTDGGYSAVTSGDYMRYYVVDKDGADLYVNHIIDRSGAPVGISYGQSGWEQAQEWVVSATVVGNSSALCDALSTAVCVLGIERGAMLLENVGYKGLIFTEKRYTIIGNIPLYKTDVYNGYTAYERYEP